MLSQNKLNFLCNDVKNYIKYYKNSDIDLNRITVYYHWTVGEYVLEIDGKFFDYCSSIDYWLETKDINHAKKRENRIK